MRGVQCAEAESHRIGLDDRPMVEARRLGHQHVCQCAAPRSSRILHMNTHTHTRSLSLSLCGVPGGTCALSLEGNALRIAAKGRDVSLHPLQGRALIQQRPVATQRGARQETPKSE
jgi:hypothetical protein